MGLEISRNVITGAKSILEQILSTSKEVTSKLSSGQQFVILQMVERLILPLQNIFELLLPTLQGAKAKKANFELIPSELIVLLKALVKKGRDGNASKQELIAISFILDAQNILESFYGPVLPK